MNDIKIYFTNSVKYVIQNCLLQLNFWNHYYTTTLLRFYVLLYFYNVSAYHIDLPYIHLRYTFYAA